MAEIEGKKLGMSWEVLEAQQRRQKLFQSSNKTIDTAKYTQLDVETTQEITENKTDTPQTLLRPEYQVVLPSKYRDEGLLGYGGSSVVRKVRDVNLHRPLALKILNRYSKEAKEQFQSEAQIMARLHHPNIVPIYGYGTCHDGRDFICMALLSGETLADRLRRLGQQRHDLVYLKEHLRVLLRVSEALVYAHRRGILHLDVKPQNVMVGGVGQVYLLDWGIAQFDSSGPQLRNSKKDRSGGIIGTPGYMAPEQETLSKVSAVTDVYGIGGVLHTILTGHAPRSSVYDISEKPKFKDIPQLVPHAKQDLISLYEELEEIARKALNKKPDNRHQSMLEFSQAIEYQLNRLKDFESQLHPTQSEVVA